MATHKPARYFGDITWFSQRSTKPSYGTVWKALSSHINYIARPSRPDLICVEGLDKEKWKGIADNELSKRWDSRIAAKFTLALPNSLNLEQAKALVKDFVSTEIGPQSFGFALHWPKGIISGEDNLHAHIVFSARGQDGKKLRLNRTKLKNLQRKWDEYVEKYCGQKPYRHPEKGRTDIRPCHLRPDSALYDPLAVQYVKARYQARKYIEEAEKAERKFVLERKKAQENYQERKEESIPSQEKRGHSPPVEGKPKETIEKKQFEEKRSVEKRLSESKGLVEKKPAEKEKIRLDRLFYPWPDYQPSMLFSELRNQILSLEREIESLKEQLTNTSWLNVWKRAKLLEEINERQTRFDNLVRREKALRDFDTMTRQWLKEFINMLYERPDVSPHVNQIAILAVHPEGDRKQFLVKIAEIEDKLPYLRKLNVDGYNIYATVNVLQPGATSRKAGDFLPFQTAIYLDLDSKQKPASVLWREVWQAIQEGRLLEPSYIVKSSTGNYQIYWVCEEPVEAWKLRAIMEGLNQHFNLDHTHDIARVFRIPGLRNRKPGKNDLVQPPKGNVIWIAKEKGWKVQATLKKYSKAVFEKLLEIWKPRQPTTSSSSLGPQKHKVLSMPMPTPKGDPELERLYQAFYARRDRYASTSELDMAFVLKALAKGYPSDRIISFLSLTRVDKPDPTYYATHTVQKGIAYLKKKQAGKKSRAVPVEPTQPTQGPKV